MHRNEYLYGLYKPMSVPQEIIDDRVEALHKELEVQINVSFMQRDGNRCNAIIKAIKFWEDINK